MATAHLAVGSAGYRLLHVAVWVDGAVGFVFLAGLMLGRMQCSLLARSSAPVARRRLLRRTGTIYAGHVFICVVAMVAVAVDPVRAGPYSGLTELGGPLPALGSVLLLRVNPWSASILSLYVVLTLLALVAVTVLRKARWHLVLGVSVMLYAAGIVWPSTFSFSLQPGVPGAVNWASWQLLFMVAMVIGWHWSADAVRATLGSTQSLLAAALAAGALVIWAQISARTVVSAGSLVGQLFSDGTLGPGSLFMALVVGLVLYRGIGQLTGPARRLLVPIAVLGRHSLDCYLILSVVVIAAPLIVQYRRSSITADLVVVGFLLMCWCWCSFREFHPRWQSPLFKRG